MTQPPEPTPGAPATEPTPQQPGPAPAQPAEPAVEDISALPEWAQKQIRDARAEAAKSRTTAKQTAAEQARQETLAQVAKALGIGEEGKPVDPAELTAQIEQAQTAAWRSAVELAVYRAAPQHGANPDALLDSLKFIDSLDDLVEVDPRSPEFAAALASKVQEAVAGNPSYKAAAGQAPAAQQNPRPDPTQGSRGAAPAPTRTGSLTEAIRAHYSA